MSSWMEFKNTFINLLPYFDISITDDIFKMYFNEISFELHWDLICNIKSLGFNGNDNDLTNFLEW